MTFRQFSGIVELRTKIVSASTYSIGLLYALAAQGSVDSLKALLLGVAGLLVDMGTTGFNTYFDWYRNVDDPRFNREEEKVLVHEGVSPGSALGISLICFGLAGAVGLALTWMVGLPLLVLGLCSMLVGFFYSAGPKPISSTPLGELFAGGFLGSVYFCICLYVLMGTFSGRFLLVSLPQTLAIAAILSANNACDIEGDSAAGRRTLAVILGKASAPLLIYAEMGFALLLLMIFGLSGILPVYSAWCAMLGGIVVVFILNRMHRIGYSHETKGPIMKKISLAFMVQSAAQIAALSSMPIFGKNFIYNVRDTMHLLTSITA